MSGIRFTRDDLIDALHTLTERVDRTPIEADTYKHPDIPGHMVFVRRFGTWREALQAAGIPLNPLHMGYDRETLLEHLRSVAGELGRAPAKAELTDTSGPSPKPTGGTSAAGGRPWPRSGWNPGPAGAMRVKSCCRYCETWLKSLATTRP